MASLKSANIIIDLAPACARLVAGELVAIPTETVYGLAAAIGSTEGLKKIFALKERPFFDPLIVHVASFKEAAQLVSDWPPLADFLARSFWPGPFTLVLPKAKHVNYLITSGLETVAIRYPAHPIAQELIRLVGQPLAAPSANRFGRTSPTSPKHVQSEFPHSDLLILDGGDCEIGVESTVVSVTTDEVCILRPGQITEERIRLALKKWAKDVRVFSAANLNIDAPEAPGALKHHYMPEIPLVIVPIGEGSELRAETRLKIQNALGVPIQRTVELSLNPDPVLAARELYSEMRRLAETGVDCMFVRSHDNRDGLWSAIWDRLEKAASLVLCPPES